VQKTVFDADSRRVLLERLMRIQTGSKPQWGQLNAVKMLRHVSAGMEMALGELPVAPKTGPTRFVLVRWLVLYAPFPWPKGAPTAPELLTQPTAGVEEEQLRLRATLDRFVARGPAGAFTEHAAFGNLSAPQWARLTWLHIDHHLRQFGM
jgi:hypothetical protein